MTDEVMVQPVRTFLEGSDLKHATDDPYPVSRSRALELRGNGLVTFEGGPAEPALPDPEPEPTNSRGRRQRPA